MSSSIIALLIALISVSKDAYPVIAKSMKGEFSHISTNLFVMNAVDLHLLASNTGTKPGTIANAALYVGDASRPMERDLADFIEIGLPELKQVNAGEMDSYTYHVSLDLLKKKLEANSHREVYAYFSVKVVDFGGCASIHEFQFTYTCGYSQECENPMIHDLPERLAILEATFVSRNSIEPDVAEGPDFSDEPVSDESHSVEPDAVVAPDIEGEPIIVAAPAPEDDECN